MYTHHSFFFLLNVKSYVRIYGYRFAGGIGIAADRIRCGDSRLIQNAVSGGGGDGDTCDCSRGADRCGDRRRSLQVALECHIGVLLIRIDRGTESCHIKWCTARAGHIGVARALSCACARAFALTVTRAVAAAVS